jgi:26S proteasome regulatory subunit N5
MTMDGVQASGAASGGFLEEKLDLTSETDAKLAQARQLASSGNLPEALALLSALEKRCRVGNDSTNLVRTCEASLHLCRDAGDDDALLTTLTSLATRRSQKVAAISALVKTCLPWCVTEPYTPLGTTNVTLRDALVRELRDISDGKLFLERERAVTTRVLATILETAGDIAGAADLLQQVHVETYGSLSKQEKVEYILEQFRLTLAKQDYVRAAIVASKINKKYLTEENMQDYKVKFYTLFAIYHAHEKDAFSLAKDYFAIYSTPNISNDDALWIPALQATILFLALSPYGNEQRDMLHRLSLDANLEKVPACQ